MHVSMEAFYTQQYRLPSFYNIITILFNIIF